MPKVYNVTSKVSKPARFRLYWQVAEALWNYKEFPNFWDFNYYQHLCRKDNQEFVAIESPLPF